MDADVKAFLLGVWGGVKMVGCFAFIVTAGLAGGEGDFARAAYNIGLALFLKD